MSFPEISRGKVHPESQKGVLRDCFFFTSFSYQNVCIFLAALHKWGTSTTGRPTIQSVVPLVSQVNPRSCSLLSENFLPATVWALWSSRETCSLNQKEKIVEKKGNTHTHTHSHTHTHTHAHTKRKGQKGQGFWGAALPILLWSRYSRVFVLHDLIKIYQHWLKLTKIDEIWLKSTNAG